MLGGGFFDAGRQAFDARQKGFSLLAGRGWLPPDLDRCWRAVYVVIFRCYEISFVVRR